MDSVLDHVGTVAGVLMAIGGLSLVLMGTIGMANRRWRNGALASAAGLAVLVVGLWLSGVL
jgi:hypothetical protein